MTETKPLSETFAKIIGTGILFSSGILAVAPLSACFGALAGWTVGLLFGNTILGVLAQLGLHGVALWQLGATCGFFGSFLRTSTTVRPK